jgi:SAM-dependent MidA family methyltransferase
VDIEPALRHDPARPLSLPDSDPVLVERLRSEISATGPITFARFMTVALGDPDHGYYATTDERPTRRGDFLTAPELHPIFGATIGRAIEGFWRTIGRPATFALREYGAGSARLAIDVLSGLAERQSDLLEAIRYEPIELVPGRVELIHRRLTDAGFGSHLADRAVVGRKAGATGVAGMVLANEFLDALPVHRIEGRAGEIRELYVDWSIPESRFLDALAPASTPAIAERLERERITLAEGQQAEVCLALDDWGDELTAWPERGFGLVIDYGREAPDLYRPDRRRGTLMAYAGQRAREDPYVAIGRQDLTAHVDFTAVANAVERAGWRPAGLVGQAAFLMANGLQDELERRRSDPALTPEAYLELRSAVARLLDPRALGAFGVLVMSRGID